MRTVSLIASVVLVLVLAAAVADASLFTRKHSSSSATHKSGGGIRVTPAELMQHRRVGRATKNLKENIGNVYEMAYDLLAAFQTRNYTWAASLIDDDAIIAITGISCGLQSKQQLLSVAQNDGHLASYFQFGTYAGYQDGAMGAIGTIGAILGPNSGEANRTVIINDAVFYFMPNQAGTQLALIEQFTDRSWAQPNNATAMRNVWQTMADAANIHDVAAFGSVLTENSAFYIDFAWNQFPSQEYDNKTAITSMLRESWAHQSKFGVKTNFVIVACEFVIAQMTWSTVNDDGSAQIMNFIMSLIVDENMKVSQFTEFPLMPFM